ncbi:S-layer homology domain-containing protein [Thermoanaerobacterium saccharolyticum]|uniref:S-layer homology domain-containing protein n=1 Tax=Thermoanaerobacterium saccharolyticum TaxID=28896 RepID=UPI002FDAF9EB
MKNLKKLIAVVLTFTLVFSAMAVGFAGTFSDVSSSAPYASAVARLQSLGLVSGMPDGTYQPDGVVTRAQMIAFVNAAEGLQQAAQLAVGPTKFKDVPASYWASGDINIADPSGYPDGTFKPDNAVTYPEALALILRALGYTADYSWPYGVIAKATNVGITNGVTLAANATINRGQMAMLINNALDLDINKYDSNGVEVDSGTKLISKATNMTEYLVVATHDVDSSVAEGKVKVQEVSSTDSTGKRIFKTPTTINVGNVDFNKYLGKVVDVYSAKGGDPVAADVVTTDYTFTTDNPNDVNHTVAGVIYDENGNDITNELQYGSNTPIVYNGVKTTLGAANVKIYDGATVTLTDTDNDGKYDYIVVTNAFKYGPLTVDSDVKASDAYIKTNGVSLQVSGGDIDSVVVTGSVNKLSDIKADDVVYYALSADGSKVTLLVVRDSVQGKVTKVAEASDGTYTVTINGKDYTVAKDANGNPLYSGQTPAVDDNGTFVLDKDGKIAAFIGTTATSNYAYVLAVDDSSAVNPQVKLFTSDGKTVVYPYDTSSTKPIKNDLISYSLNSDNTVTDVINYSANEKANVPYDSDNKVLDKDKDVLADTYYVNSSTVVINIYDGSYNVVNVDDITASKLNVVAIAADEYNNVKALVVNDASLSETDEASVMYGIVTDYSTVKTSDGTYYTLDVLANGTEQTLTTTTDVSAPTKSTESAPVVYRISLNSDNQVRELTVVPATTPDVDVKSASTSGITADGGSTYALGSNATVVRYDTVNDEYYVAGINSLTDNDTVTLYKDSTGRVVFVVVK